MGLDFDPTYVDSLILAQNLLPGLGKYKLDIVAEHLDLPAFNHHRASDDAATVGYMLIPFWKMLHERGIHTLQAVNKEMESCGLWAASQTVSPSTSLFWPGTRWA